MRCDHVRRIDNCTRKGDNQVRVVSGLVVVSHWASPMDYYNRSNPLRLQLADVPLLSSFKNYE